MREEIVVEGDQDHLVTLTDNRVHQENGHFSEEFHQNSPFDVGFGFGFGLRSTDEFSSKKIKLSPFNQQGGEEIDSSEESSPLGLKLNKSPSLISLLERKLSEGIQTKNTSTKLDYNCDGKKPKSKPTSKLDDFVSQPMSERLKASNFPAMALNIGTWERISMHEGDLVAKCYYAKRKLVWEVLEGALNSKIEIQWSDIIGIRATIIDDQPGTLEIELNQPPSFFRETDPQPRKHTLWHQASDFTGNQAPICRRHQVRFAPGILDKHYEKLLQCDQRLQNLSRGPFPSHQSLYFDAYVYGLSEFSLDFNGCGPQFFAGLQYPCQNYPAVPVPSHSHVQILRHATRPPLQIMDSNSPMPVNDFMLENQRRDFWSGANFAKGNHIHLGEPNLTPVAHANMDFSSHVNAMAYKEVSRKSNADMGLLADIENHLLGENTQMLCSSDENTITARMMHSMYPLLDPEELPMNPMSDQMTQGDPTLSGGLSNPTLSGGLVCYSEPTNWIPQNFDEGIMTTNNLSYPYDIAAYQMTEEFSTLATNPKI